MNKTNLVDFCLTGFLQPRAHLSKGLSRLTFLQPNHFPLVSFQSQLFLLSLLLSSLIPAPFLLLSEYHFYLTVSFHSSASGLHCKPLLCHSTPVLKPGWNSQWAQAERTYKRNYNSGVSCLKSTFLLWRLKRQNTGVTFHDSRTHTASCI